MISNKHFNIIYKIYYDLVLSLHFCFLLVSYLLHFIPSIVTFSFMFLHLVAFCLMFSTIFHWVISTYPFTEHLWQLILCELFQCRVKFPSFLLNFSPLCFHGAYQDTFQPSLILPAHPLVPHTLNSLREEILMCS